ncbi:hypothetical protein Dimus_014391 [Dionaea muscipula]
MVGPIPDHVAFILDGNRRYARKHNMKEGDGHRCGFLSIMSILKYCYELGIKYVSIYAFSIDNFRRRPEEVKILMDLMLEKIEGLLKEESIVNHYNVRVHFVGNLRLLDDPVRVAAEKVMRATASNTKAVLLIFTAYNSSHEVAHAVQETCLQQMGNGSALGYLKRKHEEEQLLPTDIERHLYTTVLAPEPDILLRSSGETRLSNFLVWQSKNCLLYSPAALWPEIGLRHIIWAVLSFQRHHRYLQEKKKMHT